MRRRALSPILDRAAWVGLAAQFGRTGTAWPTLAVLLFDLLLVAAALLLAQRTGPARTATAIALLTLALSHFYLVHHECVHRAVFARDRLNRLLGGLLGFALLYPFPQRRRAHLLHHRWAGHPERDPANARAIERFRQLSPRALRCCDVLWRAWVPFLVINERAALWLEPFRRPPANPRARRWERAAVISYALVHAAVWCALARLDQAELLARVYLPSLALSLVLEEAINLPHHAEAPLVRRALHLWEQGAVTHACRSYWFWSRWVLLHFNLHATHHLFPKLPWYRLPHAEQAVGEDHARLPHELSWNARRRRRPFREVFGRYFRPPV